MKILRAVNELCTGCDMCVIACSLAKTGIINPYLARIKISRTEDGVSTPVICRHCKNAPCMAVCPIPGAMYVDTETNAVVIDESKCTS